MAGNEGQSLHGRTTRELAEHIAMGYLVGQGSRAEIVDGMRAAMQGDDAARRQLQARVLQDVTDARDKARLLTSEQINSDPRAVGAIRDLAEIDGRWGGSNGLVSRAVRHVDQVLEVQGEWLKGWPEVKVPMIGEMGTLLRESGNWDAAKWEAEADTIDEFTIDELQRLGAETETSSNDLARGQEALRVAMEGVAPVRASAATAGGPGPEQSWDRARARVVDQAPMSRADDFGR